MQILVTGATGFLGKFLTEALEQLGHNITQVNSKNCDLTDSKALTQFDSIKFDRIYHLAAWTQAGDFCLRYPGDQWLINQKINTNMLTWFKESQSQAKLICMGTSCAYSPDEELKEINYLKGLPIDSLFTYAMTKKMLYSGLLALNKQYKLKYLYLVPSTLYGPSYHTDGRQMHFIFDLIRKILNGKTSDKLVSLWGDGYQKRELVLVNDFVKVMIELSDTLDNDIVNIGTGKEYTIRSFAQKICHQIDYDFNEIEFDTSKYVGAKSKCLEISKMRSLLPNTIFSSLDEGLKLTIEWFQKQISNKTLIN